MAAASVLLGGIVAPCAAEAPELFGSEEVEKDNLAPFPKWTGVLERFVQEKGQVDAPCQPSATNKCHFKTWSKFVADIRSLDPQAQLEKTNAFLNQAPYVVDPVNWGVKDYWATPGQFFAKFGDCEDYAIAKFMTLRALGYSNQTMRVVVVDDLNLKTPHAVLAVYRDGKIYILDNQIKQVVEATTIRHYRPIYSVNEDHWWLHKPRRG